MQISKWVALGVAAFCLVAVGGVVNLPQLYYMAAMLLTLPAVSYLVGWYSLHGIEFVREPSATIWEGEETEIVYQAVNHSRIPRFFISICEPVGPHLDSLRMDPPLFNIGPGDAVRITNLVRFNRRGVFQAQAFEVSAIDPLGVFTFSRTVPAQGEIVVYPMPRHMEPITLQGGEKLGFNDTAAQSRHGDGVDTSGVRNYQPGDPLRHIHWRQTARTGTLTVVEFEETQSVNLRLVLDTHHSGLFGEEPNTTLEYAVRTCATIARDAIQSGASVDLVVPGTNGEDLIPRNLMPTNQRGSGQLYSVLDSLARVETQRSETLSQLLSATASAVRRGTTILVVCIYPDHDLPTIINKSAGDGVMVAVILIDSSSFGNGGNLGVRMRESTVVEEIAAIGVPVYNIAWNGSGNLEPVRLD